MLADGRIIVSFDTGGTFTDITAFDPQRGFVLEKELSTPDNPADAIIRGLDRALGRLNRTLADVYAVYGATTMITNALIEYKGATTALVTTKGFLDLLEMRREHRYDIYDLQLELPRPYVPRNLRYEWSERIDKDGTIQVACDTVAAQQIVRQLTREGVESVAVCLLHAYRNPQHERTFLEIARAVSPEISITLSSELAPEIREYERMSTTVINAYTQPTMLRHIRYLSQALEQGGFDGRFYFMLSSGRIRPAEFVARFPAYVVESGPAAGAILAAYAGRRAGFRDIVSLDMGGTTAKICVLPNAEPRITRSFEVARTRRFKKGSGHPLKLPTVELVEIGAGGGSIASVDGLGRLKVGPQSAGADPGPACYGRGGTAATVTDANLILGYLHADHFLGGEMRLDSDAARDAVARVAEQAKMDLLATAWGIHAVADEHMARVTRVHVAELGIDPRRYVMVAFGGAGPTHACRVAQRVGIRTILCPPGAGVASALGLLVAPPGVDLVASRPELVAAMDLAAINALVEGMRAEGRDTLVAMGVPDSELSYRLSADMRYLGQGQEIEVVVPEFPRTEEGWRAYLRRNFDVTYQQLYGRSFTDLPVEVINWRLAVAQSSRANLWWFRPPQDRVEADARPAYFPELGGMVETPVYQRATLPPGWRSQGPAIIEERESTIVVTPGADVTVDEQGNVVITL